MQVSSGRPHMLTSNQRGRGNDPVCVLGRIRSAVAVNMGSFTALYSGASAPVYPRPPRLEPPGVVRAGAGRALWHVYTGAEI